MSSGRKGGGSVFWSISKTFLKRVFLAFYKVLTANQGCRIERKIIFQTTSRRVCHCFVFFFAALSFSPDDIAKEISTYIPDFKINYSPDFRNKIAKSWPSSINDQDARKDWGWEEEFDLKKMTLKMIEGIRTNNSLASSSI